jgi:hypothetical protein
MNKKITRPTYQFAMFANITRKISHLEREEIEYMLHKVSEKMQLKLYMKFLKAIDIIIVFSLKNIHFVNVTTKSFITNIKFLSMLTFWKNNKRKNFQLHKSTENAL